LFSSPQRIVGAGCALLLVHAVVLLWLGTAPPGPFVSDLIQLMLGGLLVLCCFRAARATEALACHFWQLASLAFSIWLVAQGIATYGDLAQISVLSEWSENLLFSFWFVPLAMALFLDPDREHTGFDWLMALDFVQAVLFCIAAYLYFFYIPRSESPTELAHSVWSPYFAGCPGFHPARQIESPGHGQIDLWPAGNLSFSFRDCRRVVLLRSRKWSQDGCGLTYSGARSL
jgi:hypothetical protein